MVIARMPAPVFDGQPVKAAIAQASQATGESFDFLVRTAVKELSLQPDAKAAGSSAAGLFQFIESTWLRLVRDHGDKYGLGGLSREIKGEGDSRPKVEDAATRERIMNLRFDPKVSAQMAAELTSENRAVLQGALGRPVGDTELYLAHFLGSGGATRFLTERQSNPAKPAAALFPDAASANPSIFYDQGRARSLDEVFQRLARGFSETPTDVAEASGPQTPGAQTQGRPAEDRGSVSVDEFVATLFRTSGMPSMTFTLSPAMLAAMASLEPVRALGGTASSSRPEGQADLATSLRRQLMGV